VASLLDLAGLDWPVPDLSALGRRQKTLIVHIAYRSSTGALHLLIDSAGVNAEGEGEWLASKHGPSKPRDWRKVHLGIDAETLEIHAIEITGSRIGEAPILPDLPDQIADDQCTGIVTADGAYDTRACHAAIAARGAAACAGLSGSAGPAPIDEARSRPRCAALSCPASWLCPETSKGRSPSFRSGPQS
jgi:hypothetical protein